MSHIKHKPSFASQFSIAKRRIYFLLLFMIVNIANAQKGAASSFAPEKLEQQTQSVLRAELMDHDPAWYGSLQAIQIADNMLVWQRGSGGWPKNMDMLHRLSGAELQELTEYKNEPLATIDNGATYTQMNFLARVIRATRDQRYVLSFLKGLDYLIEAQYDNGGWPQFYPLRKGYYSHITFNDDAMIGVMRLLRDVAENPSEFDFVDAKRREQARLAVEKGIACILKTQVKVGGQLTAWCAQYDEKTLQPASARKYELVSLSGDETTGILRFLMHIQNPSPEIVKSVQCAVAWLKEVRILGIRVIHEPDSTSPTGYNKVVISDPNAPPMWARFYQIGSNKPFFSDRDGKVYYNLADISSERRNDYGWLGHWPEDLLEDDYPKWQKRWAPDENVVE